MPKKILQEIIIENMTPQQAIKYLTNIVNQVPYPDKRFLRIEPYYDDYGNPFEQNPTKNLRLIVETP